MLSVVAVGYLALTTAAVLCGLLLTEVLLGRWLGRWDLDVEEALVRRRTETWDDLTNITSTMGDTLTVIVVAGIAALGLWVWRGWRAAALLVTALVVECSVFLTTTALIDRPRPPLPRLDEVPPTSSFPSGRAAAAVALYVGLAVLLAARVPRPSLRTLVWLVGVALAAAVALGRLYRAMHYPTDVTAGALIGAASVVVAVLAVRAIGPPDGRPATPRRSRGATGEDRSARSERSDGSVGDGDRGDRSVSERVGS